MNVAIIPIMFAVLLWRIAVRPAVVRQSDLKAWFEIPSTRAVVIYFVLGFLELGAAIVLVLAWPHRAWLSITVIFIGQELRFWLFNARLPKSPRPGI